ncbi:MAG TPA: sigma factor, partial [Mucilaginibacter sp.]|nr:sigma factor [Mucilaginibacter sp.]
MHGISNTDRLTQRQQLFIDLYKSAFPAVAKYVSRLGGSFDEAKDVFQDALVAYYEKTTGAPSALNNDTAYLVGIAKNLWLRRYRQSAQNLPLTDLDMAFDELEESPSNNRLM